jgi:chromosome segregation ATPase
MSGFTDDEILGVWVNVTDFTGGWQETIGDFLERINALKAEWKDYPAQDALEDLRKRIVKLRNAIEETVEKARSGEMLLEELENAFRDHGEDLASIESELLELEVEPEYEEDLEGDNMDEYDDEY